MINVTIVQIEHTRKVKSITLSAEEGNEKDYEILNKVFMGLMAGNVKEVTILDQPKEDTDEPEETGS